MEDQFLVQFLFLVGILQYSTIANSHVQSKDQFLIKRQEHHSKRVCLGDKGGRGFFVSFFVFQISLVYY